MPLKLVATIVALIGSSAACVGSAEDAPCIGSAEVTVADGRLASTTSELPVARDDVPTPGPLDHSVRVPKPMRDRSFRPTPPPDDVDIFFGLREPNRRTPGCYVELLSIYDPGRGRNIEVPVTRCM